MLPATGNYLYLESSTGDYIGQGQTTLYTDANATFVPDWGGRLVQLFVDPPGGWTANFSGQDQQPLLRLLLVHIGVYGPKLRAEVVAMAHAHKAHVVVCGHSHVPFLGRDRGLTVFNPGSIGPRRFQLPIVFGTIDVTPAGLRLAHVDCETGAPWTPP